MLSCASITSCRTVCLIFHDTEDLELSSPLRHLVFYVPFRALSSITCWMSLEFRMVEDDEINRQAEPPLKRQKQQLLSSLRSSLSSPTLSNCSSFSLDAEFGGEWLRGDRNGGRWWQWRSAVITDFRNAPTWASMNPITEPWESVALWKPGQDRPVVYASAMAMPYPNSMYSFAGCSCLDPCFQVLKKNMLWIHSVVDYYNHSNPFAIFGFWSTK